MTEKLKRNKYIVALVRQPDGRTAMEKLTSEDLMYSTIEAIKKMPYVE